MATSPALCPAPLWESLAHVDAGSTFFHTPAWLNLAARHFSSTSGKPTEPAPLLFEFAGGPACLPLLRDTRWGRARYFSPFGTYTSLLCAHEPTAADLAETNARLKTLNLQFASSPFTGHPVGAGRVIPSRTHVVDLVPAQIEDPTTGWVPNQRRRIRIARENGMTVRAAGSPQDWDGYYGLYLKSLQRWGAGATNAYPRSLFDAIHSLQTAATPGGARQVVLWLCEREGKPVGGFIAFYHNTHACIWHGAADEEYFKLGSTQLLYHEMIADAARGGYRVFDLLGSAGLTALETFKASMGGRAVEHASFVNRTGLVGWTANLRDRLIRSGR